MNRVKLGYKKNMTYTSRKFSLVRNGCKPTTINTSSLATEQSTN